MPYVLFKSLISLVDFKENYSCYGLNPSEAILQRLKYVMHCTLCMYIPLMFDTSLCGLLTLHMIDLSK